MQKNRIVMIRFVQFVKNSDELSNSIGRPTNDWLSRFFKTLGKKCVDIIEISSETIFLAAIVKNCLIIQFCLIVKRKTPRKASAPKDMPLIMRMNNAPTMEAKMVDVEIAVNSVTETVHVTVTRLVRSMVESISLKPIQQTTAGENLFFFAFEQFRCITVPKWRL